MEDDIDIEEHDVLENPKIRNIFPDLARIKTEAPDIEIEEPVFDQNEDFYFERTAFEHPGIEITHVSSQYMDNDDEYQHYGNKIILGSKPCHTLVENTSNFTENYENMHPLVLLEDWGPELERSTCYCKECQILYPNENALDSHKMIAHSFLIALDDVGRNRAIKSTTKPALFKNTARKSTGLFNQVAPKVYTPKLIPTVLEETKICNHCNNYFPDNAALVKHLYELLPLTTFKCNICDIIFSTEEKLNKHNDIHIEKESKLTQISQCPICSCYFMSKKYLVKHFIIDHKNRDLKPNVVTFDPKCLFCDKHNVQKLYNYHIKKFHNDMYTSVITKQSSDGKMKYQCAACKKVFMLYSKARVHRKIKHPELKNLRLIYLMNRDNKLCSIKKLDKTTVPLKITATHSKVQKAETAASKSINDCVINNRPVCKSTLFKCNTCDLHFLCSRSVIGHMRSCNNKGLIGEKCDICLCIFNAYDIKYHKLQHKSTNNLKVYVNRNNLGAKVLCHCPNCDIYMEEKSFWEHYYNGCDKMPRFQKCLICDLRIYVKNMLNHTKKHKILKYTENDFITVEFFPFSKCPKLYKKYTYVPKKQIESTKRRISDSKDVDVPIKKRKIVPSLVTSNKNSKDIPVLFYCTSCFCYFNYLRGSIFHKRKLCVTQKRGLPARVCDECGLKFTAQSYIKHQEIHTTGRQLTIKDFKIIRITDNKCISAPMPVYICCEKCGDHSYSRRKHKCNEGSMQCSICNMKFDKTTYKLHIQFHQTPIRQTDIENNTKELPELLKKYKSLEKMWDILYLCDVCDTVTDSYDKVVDHCQKHYNNTQKYGAIIEQCKICRLKFDQVCFKKHMKLHMGNEKINKNSFRILKYSYTDLLSDNNWFNMLNKLPKEQIQQILSKTIYAPTRSIKMRLVGDGPPHLTLYKCEICKNYISPSSIRSHALKFDACKKNIKRYVCKVCSIPFCSQKAKDEHENIHTMYDLEPSWVRIVYFNNEKDIKINKAVNSVHKREIHVKKHKIVVAKKKLILLKLYKCRQCGVAIRRKYNTTIHTCCILKKHTCKLCGLLFMGQHIAKHMKHHKEFPKLERKNIKIVPFKPSKPTVTEMDKSETDDENVVDLNESNIIESVNYDETSSSSNATANERVSKVYKCTCGLHFVSMRSIKKHFEYCNPKSTISKENCSKCGLLFPTEALVSHLCSHHSNGNTKVKVEQVSFQKNKHKSIPVYQCGTCNIISHFKFNINTHRELCESVHNSVDCNECKMKIYLADINHHRNLHDQYKNECLTDLYDVQIQQFMNSSNVTVDKKYKCLNIPFDESNIFKCNNCGIHYSRPDSLLRHLKLDHQNHKMLIPCKVCGLKFTSMSLNRHESLHVKLKANCLRIISLAWDSRNGLEIVTDEIFNISKVNRNISEVATADSDENIEDSNESTKEIVFSNNHDEFIENLIPNNEESVQQNNSIIEKVKTEDSDYSSFDEIESQNMFPCPVCKKKYKTQITREFHVNLDHADSKILCPICKIEFHKSILNELHLQIRDDLFTCCKCTKIVTLDLLKDHHKEHDGHS